MADDFTKLKRYVATKTFDAPGIKGAWKKGTVKRINPNKLRPYIAARLILPFRVALDEKVYVPQGKESTIEKVVEAITGVEIEPSPKKAEESPAAVEKSFLGNKLRQAIQKKKEEVATVILGPDSSIKSTSSDIKKTTLSADKLAAIKAGGKK